MCPRSQGFQGQHLHVRMAVGHVSALQASPQHKERRKALMLWGEVDLKTLMSSPSQFGICCLLTSKRSLCLFCCHWGYLLSSYYFTVTLQEPECCKPLSQGLRIHSGCSWHQTDVGAGKVACTASLSFYSLQECTLPAFLPTNASLNTSLCMSRTVPSLIVFWAPSAFSIQKCTLSLVSTPSLLACFCISASAEIK